MTGAHPKTFGVEADDETTCESRCSLDGVLSRARGDVEGLLFCRDAVKLDCKQESGMEKGKLKGARPKTFSRVVVND